jgi:hypothetical protein
MLTRRPHSAVGGNSSAGRDVEAVMKRIHGVRIAVCAAALIAAVGCSGDDAVERSQPSATAPATGRSTVPSTTRPYSLLTHCGIEWARIDGVWWQAESRLSDGSGNPPAGWANPTQNGILEQIDGSTMRFVSPAGSVVFHASDLTRSPVSCD